jgi:hypothetical protein
MKACRSDTLAKDKLVKTTLANDTIVPKLETNLLY